MTSFRLISTFGGSSAWLVAGGIHVMPPSTPPERHAAENGEASDALHSDGNVPLTYCICALDVLQGEVCTADE